MHNEITGVILAGGQGSRMGGEDKGLLTFRARPLIEWVLAGLQPQVGHILISANRHAAQYRQYGYFVLADAQPDYQGPLAGIVAALRMTATPYLLVVPCDAPRVPAALAQRLLAQLQAQQADVAVAHDGIRLQPTYALIAQHLLADAQAFFAAGGRSLKAWYARQRMVSVDFADCALQFRNMNTPAEKRLLEGQIPLLGFCAYSGTGKTTLLTQLIPQLNAAGLRVAVVKHTHHVIDLDQPGKDSYRMREAGAQQVVLASHRRIISMQEMPSHTREASLADAVSSIRAEHTDLILVEGFKHEAYPKIELHRPSLGKPLIFPTDGNVIAIATDEANFPVPAHLPVLNINQPAVIVRFILETLLSGRANIAA